MTPIELRWLDAPMLVDVPVLPEGMSISNPRRMILQYRVSDFDGWRDVPTVKWEDWNNRPFAASSRSSPEGK